MLCEKTLQASAHQGVQLQRWKEGERVLRGLEELRSVNASSSKTQTLSGTFSARLIRISFNMKNVSGSELN